MGVAVIRERTWSHGKASRKPNGSSSSISWKSRTSDMAISNIDGLSLAMLGLIGVSIQVLSETSPAPLALSYEEIPLYSPEDAWRLAHAPESRMVDATTCERIEGVFRVDRQGRRQVVAGAKSALFRKANQRIPFMRTEARDDGVYVARFTAKANEVIVARAYIVDPRSRRRIYGEPIELECRAGDVLVSDLMPVTEQSGRHEERQEVVP